MTAMVRTFASHHGYTSISASAARRMSCAQPRFHHLWQVFANFECKLIGRSTFPSHSAVRIAFFRLIKGWYNPLCDHSPLGQLPPVNFERRSFFQPSAESANLSTRAGNSKLP